MSSLFTAPAFLRNTNIYEVNIRQYSPEGTFNAFALHLPRLQEMGVKILWLMPIHPIGKIKRKGTLGSYYSISDHKAVNPEFGSADDLRALIAKAHALGMKVILDWVANHASWDHVWTKTNPDFFVRDAGGNFQPPFDWDDVIQIDHANIGEQQAMIDAMAYWITEFDTDGFRADLAHLTPLQFWKDARLKISSLKKDLVWLAETEEVSFHDAFDISFTWEWMHITEQLCNRKCSLQDAVNVLQKYQISFPADAHRLFFTSNHDENSWNGTEYEKYGDYAPALAVFSCTWPAVPLIYSGQELPNKKRLKFFDKDQIEWQGRPALQAFYEALLSLPAGSAAIDSGNPNAVFLFDELIEKNILAYRVTRGDDEVLVFLNMGDADIAQRITLGNTPGNYRDIFNNQTMELQNEYLFSAKRGGFNVLEKSSRKA